MILPSVFNPRVLRTGAFFAEVIAAHRLGERCDVLDLGTGSGVCAVFAARHAHRVVAVDLKGFGQSDKPFDERYSAYDQAELLAQLIEDKDRMRP